MQFARLPEQVAIILRRVLGTFHPKNSIDSRIFLIASRIFLRSSSQTGRKRNKSLSAQSHPPHRYFGTVWKGAGSLGQHASL